MKTGSKQVYLRVVHTRIASVLDLEVRLAMRAEVLSRSREEATETRGALNLA